MRSRIYRFRVKLCTATADRSDYLFEPTFTKARQRAAEMLLLHNTLYEQAIVITPQGKETTYVRYNSRVVSASQRKAWERKERKQKEQAAEGKKIAFLVTTSRGPKSVYGVIECGPLTDPDLLFLCASMTWQRNRPGTDLALHEITPDNQLLRIAANDCYARRQYIEL